MNAKFNFIIPDELLERVRAIAKEKGVTISAVINDALRNTLEGDRLAALESRVAELEREVRKIKNEK